MSALVLPTYKRHFAPAWVHHMAGNGTRVRIRVPSLSPLDFNLVCEPQRCALRQPVLKEGRFEVSQGYAICV
jgi:hypothetical protein